MRHRRQSEPCSCGSGCDCGCCEGTQELTPAAIYNRPGLDALAYRIGTQSAFLETMKADLTSAGLAGLTTREASDPSIALLDAWAVVADVLTFYQERIANEGYLRTATERLSVLELARLVGYVPRPGVAASVYLAYTLEETVKPPVAPGSPVTPVSTSVDQPEIVIPAGARAQSVPGPGETQQPFETSDDLTARAAWNRLQVRLTQPQQPELLTGTDVTWPVALYFQGISTQLKPNDPLLIDTGAASPDLYRVMAVQPDASQNRTRVDVQPWLKPPAHFLIPHLSTRLSPGVLGTLGKPPTQPPGSSLGLARDAGTLLAPGSDLSARLLAVARPELRNVLYTTWANVPVAPPPALAVCALRTKASVFGHNAPLELVRRASDGVILRTKEWDLNPAGGGTAAGETITLKLAPSFDSPAFNVDLTLQISGQAEAQQQLGFNTTHPIQQFDYGDESVQATVLAFPTSNDPTSFSLDFYFKNRDVHVTVAADQPDGETEVYKVTGSGLVTRTVVVKKSQPQPQPQGLVILETAVELEEVRSIEVEEAIDAGGGETEAADVVFLDNSYPQIQPGGWIVLERPDSNLNGTPLVVASVLEVKDVSRAAYGLAGKSTRVKLSKPWLQLGGQHPDTFAVIRGTAVYAQCEDLPLAEVPIADAVCGGRIELDALYDGLQPGRWLIVTGERTDVGEVGDDGKVAVPVPGVPGAELVMLAGVDQGTLQRNATGDPQGPPQGPPQQEPVPGERTHSTLLLATPLAYCYKRDTLTLYGNVAHATHGQTRSEVLGSGDGSQALQSFTLKQPPLTWISAATPSGIDSTLTVRVNDVRWHLADSLADLGPADRSYVLRTDDGGQTTVVFGNGQNGARLPTGSENVRALYRSGIGAPGNVDAGQISQLATRPLGVKDVINPLPATGGADPESRDQARRNAPLAVLALDRLISVQDYEDFSRTFAGVGKASAALLSDGRTQLVHVTVAGEGDVPIGADSDLLKNLAAALRQLGDPNQPLQVAVRSRTFLVVTAAVQLLPDYFWDAVEPQIRAALLDAFGFDRRDLGQDALLSQVYATIQGVRGVDFADVTVFARKDPEDLSQGLDKGNQPKDAKGNVLDLPAPRLQARLAWNDGTGTIQPAQLLYLTPEVADTLILTERKS